MRRSAAQRIAETPSRPSARAVAIEGVVGGVPGRRQITVLEDSLIEGDMDARTIVIHGHVRGIVRANSIDVRATARIEGELHYRNLVVAPGARVDARCIPS
jgi:cytoskeletal protein CcmA (bactofilin family)